MAKLFPPTPSETDRHLYDENRKVFVYRGGKWDLAPLIERYKGDDDPGPIITDIHPVVDNGETVPGAGRLIENTFSITDLEELEQISGN